MTIQPEEAIKIREGEEPDIEKLDQYLKQNIDGFDKIVTVKQFPGGFSNLTFLLKTQNQEYVLRRAPLGANIKSAHDMGREFKVLSLLKDNYFAIPKVYHNCDNGEIIGAPFYLMEKVDGVILRAKNAKYYDFPPEKWKLLSQLLIDNLAQLHQINIEKTGLINLGKPEGYVDRQINGWIDRYEKSKTDELAEMEELAIWLKINKPITQKFAFLHNDYKYDNIVFDAELSKINAVLDWEMATVGDPLMDLGATLAYWCQAESGNFMKTMNVTWFEGNLTRKEIVERYSKINKIDTSDILFYYIFGLYKNATIIQQIYARWKAGFTKDPRFEYLIMGVKELAILAKVAIENKSI